MTTDKDTKMTALFPSANQAPSTCTINPLMVETPLGWMQFNCLFNEKSLSNFKPQATFVLEPRATLFSWDFEECHIEFLCSHFPPKLPVGWEVDACLAGIWRIKTSAKRVDFRFSVCLESQIPADPESGERLIAVGFEDPALQLSIGTDDEEALISRATYNKWLPSHFKDSLSSYSVRYAPHGIEVVLPESRRNDLIQIHFITAWIASTQCNPISTWYAVDQSPEYILSFLRDIHE